VAREQGRYARAAQLHADSLEMAMAAGDEWAEARGQNCLERTYLANGVNLFAVEGMHFTSRPAGTP
jgi:hypothetical protein